MIVDGYIRVSRVNEREGERFISPLVQREAIERWAQLHGAVVGEVFEELDESGARADRPLLERALTRVERGESSGIVVSRLDRFGRSLLDGLAGIERISRAGGIFVAVEDGLDLSTDTGRLVLRIMLSLGEWELDRVRSNWRTAKQRAIARGVHIGPAPAGYRRQADGRLVPDSNSGRPDRGGLSASCQWCAHWGAVPLSERGAAPHHGRRPGVDLDHGGWAAAKPQVSGRGQPRPLRQPSCPRGAGGLGPLAGRSAAAGAAPRAPWGHGRCCCEDCCAARAVGGS